MKRELIYPESKGNFDRNYVGGKGLNLLRLWRASKELKTFNVPEFFIKPASYGGMCCYGQTEYIDFQDGGKIAKEFEKLRKPVIVRSSSPLEDGENASFAGMFLSCPDTNSFDDFAQKCLRVTNSALSHTVETYADKMEIVNEGHMAIIVQRQINDHLMRGTIQVEDDIVTLESIEGKTSQPEVMQVDQDFLQDYSLREMRPLGHIGEGHYYMLMNLAKDAKQKLGLEGIVQVEFLLNPQRKPDFVQIRKLPSVKSIETELNLNVPKDCLKLESNVCNGVAGELVLPTYVTVSQSGLTTYILIPNGMDGQGNERDERAQRFYKESKLANNQDFLLGLDLNKTFKTMFGHQILLQQFNQMWERGNELFKEYILVCDKLDESIAGMANLTTNKRAIITCCESSKTSHAMTVARDLGIPAMGVNGDMHDLNYFYHQVESGDLVHMKSDGKRAVAYVEKKRDKDPYAI